MTRQTLVASIVVAVLAGATGTMLGRTSIDGNPGSGTALTVSEAQLVWSLIQRHTETTTPDDADAHGRAEVRGCHVPIRTRSLRSGGSTFLLASPPRTDRVRSDDRTRSDTSRGTTRKEGR